MLKCVNEELAQTFRVGLQHSLVQPAWLKGRRKSVKLSKKAKMRECRGMPASSWVKSVSQMPEQRVFNSAGLHVTVLFLLPGVFPVLSYILV